MAEHSAAHYIKIWKILLVLLVISVLGPMLEIQIVTLVTAFGIAAVKAYLVAKHFMHLNVEKGYIRQLLAVCVAFMVLLYMAVAPDVLKHDGQNWVNDASKASISKALQEQTGDTNERH